MLIKDAKIYAVGALNRFGVMKNSCELIDEADTIVGYKPCGKSKESALPKEEREKLHKEVEELVGYRKR